MTTSNKTEKWTFGKLNDGSDVLFCEPFAFEGEQEGQRFLDLIQRIRGGAECRCFYCGEVGTEPALKVAHVSVGQYDFAHAECFDKAVGGPTHGRTVKWHVSRPLRK